MNKIVPINSGFSYYSSSQPTTLGESPLYRSSDSTLHWIDFFSSPPTLHILSIPNHASYRIIPLPEIITCIYFRAHHPNSYICGFGRGIAYLTLHSDDTQNPQVELEIVKELVPSEDRRTMSMNDGAVDSAGRFWVSEVDMEALNQHGGAGELPKKAGKGRLWRFDGVECVKMDEGIVIGNGIAWSVDGKTMYFNDSGVQKTYAYDFEVSSGSISNKRVLIDHSMLDFPNIKEVINDGMVIDAESNLWIAMWCASCVLVFSPAGEILRRIDFPAKFMTCPTWGGEDGNTLFVTSATREGKISSAPVGDQGGHLFAWKGERVKGFKKFEFLEKREMATLAACS